MDIGKPKKSLGQHWLKDQAALSQITAAASIKPEDTVLEIGPGLGDLTAVLVSKARQVIAVELDESLAAGLPSRVHANNLKIIQGDILKFDLNQLPPDYKVVANIPYYLTSNLLRSLSESANPPSQMVLLVQKEVAERICAPPGQMGLLSVSVQLYYQCRLGLVVPAEKFSPPPKVDSQLVILHLRPTALFEGLNHGEFLRLVKAGFSERRKKLRSSLAGGLRLPKEQVDRLLAGAKIDGNRRAQELSLEDWYKVYQAYEKNF